MRRDSIIVSAFIGAAALTGAIAAVTHASGARRVDDGHVSAWAASQRTAAQRSRLTVSVSGATPGNGNLMIGLYDQETDFPGVGKHLTARVVPVIGAINKAVFEDVPYGRYAVAIIHDKNRNGRLDMRLGMLPQEPLGFSNNAKVRFGPPDFTDAAFVLTEPNKTINVALN